MVRKQNKTRSGIGIIFFTLVIFAFGAAYLIYRSYRSNLTRSARVLSWILSPAKNI